MFTYKNEYFEVEATLIPQLNLIKVKLKDNFNWNTIENYYSSGEEAPIAYLVSEWLEHITYTPSDNNVLSPEVLEFLKGCCTYRCHYYTDEDIANDIADYLDDWEPELV